jgi:hypothetical protein
VIRVNQDAVDRHYRRLIYCQLFGRVGTVDRAFEQALKEHKKQRRMEIDIEIAALLKERDSL